MWKKRFLPYSKDDTMTRPLNLESKKPLDELQLLRGQIQQQPQPQAGQSPPAAHQSSSRMTIALAEPVADPLWTQVPIQQMTSSNIQANPINHMHQQQIEFDMEMYRRQQAYDTMYKQNNVFTMPDTSMTMSTMYPDASPYSQELLDDRAIQRYQHERYLQQARDMQMADLQAEQVERFNRMVADRELSRYVTRRDVKQENVDKERMTRRSSYKAVMRNGELVEAEDGYLMVTHNVVNTGHGQAPVDMSKTSKQDSPLNLSVKDQMTTHQSDTDSGYNHSPQLAQDSTTAMNLITKGPSMSGFTKIQTKDVTILLPPAPVTKVTKLVKIAPKPACSAEVVTAVKPKDEMLKEDIKDAPLVSNSPHSPDLPQDVQALFPHLRITNNGSLVLWNFIWALLKDENYKKIVTWVSFPNLKFRIVNPSMLATLWGQVKQNPSMDWSKIKKILDLYLRKNLIVSSDLAQHEFKFLIVPKAVKDTLRTGRM